jgi:hypothetical protein
LSGRRQSYAGSRGEVAILRPSRRDLVPAQREADERHAEPLERPQPLLEGSRAELQPRVVLDPVADAVDAWTELAATQAASAKSSTISVIRPVVVLIAARPNLSRPAPRVRAA